jgi:hypothetical protein
MLDYVHHQHCAMRLAWRSRLPGAQSGLIPETTRQTLDSESEIDDPSANCLCRPVTRSEYSPMRGAIPSQPRLVTKGFAPIAIHTAAEAEAKGRRRRKQFAGYFWLQMLACRNLRQTSILPEAIAGPSCFACSFSFAIHHQTHFKVSAKFLCPVSRLLLSIYRPLTAIQASLCRQRRLFPPPISLSSGLLSVASSRQLFDAFFLPVVNLIARSVTPPNDSIIECNTAVPVTCGTIARLPLRRAISTAGHPSCLAFGSRHPQTRSCCGPALGGIQSAQFYRPSVWWHFARGSAVLVKSGSTLREHQALTPARAANPFALRHQP